MAAEMTDEHFPDEVTHRQEVIALYAYTLASFMYFGNHELREKQGVGVNSTLKVPILMTISGLAFLAQHNDIQADMKEHVDEQGHIYVYRGEGESPRRHPHCHYNEGFPVFERQSEYNMLWGFTSTSLSLGMARDYASLNGVVMMTALNVDPTNNTENRQRKRSNTIIGRKSIRLVDTAIDSTNNGNGSDGTYDTTFASGSYLGPISMEDQYEVVLVPSTRLKVIGCERMTYMVETTPINHTVEYSYDVSLRGDLSSVQEDDLLVQLRAAYLKNVRNEEIKAAEEKAREDREAEEANEKADTPEGEISDDVEDFVNILRKFVEIEVEH